MRTFEAPISRARCIARQDWTIETASLSEVVDEVSTGVLECRIDDEASEDDDSDVGCLCEFLYHEYNDTENGTRPTRGKKDDQSKLEEDILQNGFS